MILITYATTEDAVRRALHAVQQDKVITGRPQVIRIEKNYEEREDAMVQLQHSQRFSRAYVSDEGR